MVKVWFGFGSEHSANLVMIGRFHTETDARAVQDLIEKLTQQVRTDDEAGELRLGGEGDRFTEELRALLRDENLLSLAPYEIEMLAYDFDLQRWDDRIRLWTDEIDIGVFVKLMIERGAKVEVFSAHDHPEQDN